MNPTYELHYKNAATNHYNEYTRYTQTHTLNRARELLAETKHPEKYVIVEVSRKIID